MIRTVRIEGKATEDLELVSLRGHEELSRLFEYQVELLSRRAETVDAERIHELQRDPLTLVFEEEGVAMRRVHGIAVRVVARQSHQFDGVRLVLTLAPRVFDLTLRKTSEFFLDLSLDEILKKKLGAHGFTEGKDYVIEVEHRHDSRDQVSQVEETDWDFLCRQCEHWGLYFFFASRDGRDVLVISDQPSLLMSAKEPVITIPFKQPGDPHDADEVTSTFERLPRNVTIRDYNYRIPRVALNGKADVDAPVRSADIVEYGGHVKYPDEALYLARIRTEQIGTRRHVVHGRVHTLDIEAASLLSIVGGPMGDMELLVTRVDVEVIQNADTTGSHLSKSAFSAIPRDVPFRPAQRAPKPIAAGLQHATVDGAVRGPYAELDEEGRYRVELGPDPDPDKPPMTRSRRVRMLQPHGGPDYGMFFPLRPGTEVLLAHVEGDPDRPIIVGSTYNPVSPSPVNDARGTLNVLRTGARNELVMDDVVGAERVRLHSPFKGSTLQLGAKDEKEEGILTKTEEHTSFVAGKSINAFAPRSTTLVGNATTLAGSGAVLLVGFAGLDPSAKNKFVGVGAHPGPGSFDPFMFPTSLEPRKLTTEGEQIGSATTSSLTDPSAAGNSFLADPVGTFGETGELADFEASDAARRSAAAMAEAADAGARDAEPRTLGLATAPLEEPSLVLGSTGSATMFARRTAMVFSDETATLASADTSRVVADRQVDIQSPEQVEISAARIVRLTSSKLVDVRALQIQVTAGLDPATDDEALAPEFSASLYAEKAIRVHSGTGELLASSYKNFVIHSEEHNVHISAPRTVSIAGGSVGIGGGSVGIFGGEVSIHSEGNTKITADGDITIEAAGTVTIKGASIILDGPTTVKGDLTVTGNIKAGGSISGGAGGGAAGGGGGGPMAQILKEMKRRAEELKNKQKGTPPTPGGSPGQTPGQSTPGTQTPGQSTPGTQSPAQTPGQSTPGTHSPAQTPGQSAPGTHSPAQTPGQSTPGTQTPGQSTPGGSGHGGGSGPGVGGIGGHGGGSPGVGGQGAGHGGSGGSSSPTSPAQTPGQSSSVPSGGPGTSGSGDGGHGGGQGSSGPPAVP